MKFVSKPRFLQNMDKTDLFIWLFFAMIFATSLLFVRPMQDDYVALRDVSSVGLWDSVYNMWKTWGVNVSTFVISNFFINLYLYNNFFLGIALHTITTILLLLSSFRILHKYFKELINSEINLRLLVWLFLSFVCFGSLHTPGYISVLNFTLASTAHLWPTLFFVHAIYFARFNSKYMLLVLLPLGFFIGNFNISESIFCLIIILLVLYSFKSKLVSYLKVKRFNLLVLLLGQLTGLLTIILAPGFRTRSQIVLETPTLQGLIVNFLQALFYNLADILLHPGWFLALLVGYTFRSISVPSSIVISYIKMHSIVLVICILTISAGGAFAYLSWYHTMSLYLFIFPIFFGLGLVIGNYINVFRREKILFVRNVVFVFCLSLVARDAVMMGIRATHWDRDFVVNSSKISIDQFDLVGYNVNYWPLGLGLDDVEKWPWINSAYVDWVKVIHSR